MYAVLDKYSLEGTNEKKFVKLTVSKQFRSKMNVVFNLKSVDLENDFVKKAEAKGFSAIKGHRSVGGIRISIYNAVKLEAVETLIKFIEEFAQQL